MSEAIVRYGQFGRAASGQPGSSRQHHDAEAERAHRRLRVLSCACAHKRPADGDAHIAIEGAGSAFELKRAIDGTRKRWCVARCCKPRITMPRHEPPIRLRFSVVACTPPASSARFKTCAFAAEPAKQGRFPEVLEDKGFRCYLMLRLGDSCQAIRAPHSLFTSPAQRYVR